MLSDIVTPQTSPAPFAVIQDNHLEPTAKTRANSHKTLNKLTGFETFPRLRAVNLPIPFFALLFEETSGLHLELLSLIFACVR